MSACIIAFPRCRRRPHSQETIDFALFVRSIAIKVFEHNDAWHRIEGFEKASKRCQMGGRTSAGIPPCSDQTPLKSLSAGPPAPRRVGEGSPADAANRPSLIGIEPVTQ